MLSALVVMDDSLLAGLVEYKLQKHGFTVYKAEDGQDALELLGAERFDVLLLDVMIPKLDGYYVMQELKKPALNRPKVIIVLSARSGEDDILRAFELGAVDYITKPFSLNVLVERINIALKHKADHGTQEVAASAGSHGSSYNC
jgi:DNA-binding response OmpR family regulator